MLMKEAAHLLLPIEIEANGNPAVGADLAWAGNEHCADLMPLQEPLCPYGMMGAKEGDDTLQCT